MPPAIPDRWLNYKPIGERIEGTRFIAFKVPLREHVIKSVEEDNRLDGNILLKKLPSLGLIIDLTNTQRYYDPNFFNRVGVEHKKLMIPGHLTPPNNLVNIFKLYVMNFLDSNKDNDKLIGVHCTHGVNRTGYLICHYMISEMTMQPGEAIKRFDAARGHKIERENYLEALQSLTGDNSIKSIRHTIQTDADERTTTTNGSGYRAWRESREGGKQNFFGPQRNDRGFGAERPTYVGPTAVATTYKAWRESRDTGDQQRRDYQQSSRGGHQRLQHDRQQQQQPPYQRYDNQHFVRHGRSDNWDRSHNSYTYDRQHSYDHKNASGRGRASDGSHSHQPQRTNRHIRFGNEQDS